MQIFCCQGLEIKCLMVMSFLLGGVNKNILELDRGGDSISGMH